MPKEMTRFAVVSLMVGAVALLGQMAGRAQSSKSAGAMPVFEVDPSWPAIPNNWVFGQVSSVSVDKRDHVWIFQPPETVRENLRQRSAPPVLEYDASGKFVNAWAAGDLDGDGWPDVVVARSEAPCFVMFNRRRKN
jgi:hypothetical protein